MIDTNYRFTDFDLKNIAEGTFELIELKKGWSKGRKIISELHRHTFHEFIWISSGHDDHSVDFVDYEVKQNDVLCIPSGSIHRYQPSNSVTGWKIIFDESFFDERQQELFAQLEFFIPGYGFKAIRLNEIQNIVMKNMIQMLASLHFKRDQQLSILGLLIYLNDIFNSKDTTSDTTFLRFLKLANREIYNHRGVGFYSDILGVPERAMNTLVKNQTGYSTLNYLHNRLVKEAKGKLLYTQMSIKEIAFSLGFNDALYFSRFFKNKSGESPKKFRNRLMKCP